MRGWQVGLAVYAATVATFVAIRELLSDLPQVLVKRFHTRVHGSDGGTRDALSVDIANAGRRPVSITDVGYIPRGGWAASPAKWIWEGGVPFTIGEGEYRSLLLYKDELDQQIPDDAIWYARDSIGRWWPRRERLRIRWRRRMAKRSTKRA